MASTPFGLWMSPEAVPPPARAGSFSSSSTGTTAMLRSFKAQANAIRNGVSPTKAAHPDAATFSLQLTKVLGTTTSSVAGFAYRDSCFATIAGSTAVVNYIDDEYNVSQQFFRARPSALPAPPPIASPVSEAPVTPEQPRYRNVASMRAGMLGTRTPNSPVGSDVGVSSAKLVARQRTRTASCIALSPDGKYLALGETGYSPRILVFSLASNGFEAPIATLCEHTSGVRCVKFSPDGKWMCSVGDIHDGYICLWSINQRTGSPKLHSTNKCTSMINDLTFMSNNTMITVGTRHVRVWRNDEKKPPSPSKTKLRLEIGSPTVPSIPGMTKTLQGRNCLLGSLLEAKSFACVQAYSETKALICSDRGDLCLLDDGSEGPQKLQCVRRFPFSLRCIAIDLQKELVWVGGDTADVHSVPLAQVLNPSRPMSPTKDPTGAGSTEEVPASKSLAASALGIIKGRTVAIDSDRNIKLLKAVSDEKLDLAEADRTAPSHSSPVLGINTRRDDCGETTGFITWEAGGSVMFWTKTYEHERTCHVPLDSAPLTAEDEPNELKVVLPLADRQRFVSGDKRGVLRLFDGANWGHVQTTNAHAGEVTDIVQATCDDTELIVSSGRDRMIQVFELRADGLALLQTLESHGSSVNELLAIDNGRVLLSASSDRTIMISALARTADSRAYVPVRTVTLKSTPASVTLSSEDPNDVIVTTLDKQLIRFSIVEGQTPRNNPNDSLRLTDIEESESVLLTSAVTRTVRASTGPSQLLLGVSSTDKSLRVHNAYTGNTLLKDFGHSEGISSMIVLDESHEGGNSWYSIVSTGVDGTIMRWELSNIVSPTGQSSIPSSPAMETPPVIAQPPLRRVLSRSALAEYSKALEAEGPFSIPSIPSRNTSPSRLKKKFSTYSIGSGSGRARAQRPSILPSSRSNPLNRSPSPTSPAESTPTQPRTRPSLPDRNKTKSQNALNDTLHQNTDQISKNLRVYRKKMNMTSTLLKPETALELEKELIATLNVLTQRSRRQRTASGNNVGDLLDQFSEKVARLKERSRARESLVGPGSLSPVTANTTMRRRTDRASMMPLGRDIRSSRDDGSSKDDSV